MKCFFINLDRVPERRAHMEKEFGKVGLEAERFPAVDALRIEDYDNVRYMPGAGVRWEIVKSQIGVFESHRRIWQAVLARDLDMAAVFEDDMFFLPDLVELLGLLEAAGPQFDVVKLDSAFYPVPLSAPELTIGRWPLRRILSDSTSCGAYVLTRRAAEKLLEWSDPYCDHIDDFTFRPRPGWRALQAEPVVASQLSMLPRDFANRYVDAMQTVAQSERTVDPRIRQKVAKAPFLRRLRKEMKRNVRNMLWRVHGRRRHLASGGIISASRIAPERLYGDDERNLAADRPWPAG
ncbi:glycosyltransferase family 25 protein [uncultured Roseibium sp.]|uniref:glycosyltransferase family 25 protein n=1 Tax=uncultured Roseibium sp. TaxID=1936171 RepID=UPI0032176E38